MFLCCLFCVANFFFKANALDFQRIFLFLQFYEQFFDSDVIVAEVGLRFVKHLSADTELRRNFNGVATARHAYLHAIRWPERRPVKLHRGVFHLRLRMRIRLERAVVRRDDGVRLVLREPIKECHAECSPFTRVGAGTDFV